MFAALFHVSQQTPAEGGPWGAGPWGAGPCVRNRARRMSEEAWHCPPGPPGPASCWRVSFAMLEAVCAESHRWGQEFGVGRGGITCSGAGVTLGAPTHIAELTEALTREADTAPLPVLNAPPA